MSGCEAGPQGALFISHAKPSGLHPEDEDIPGPESRCGMNAQWATQAGTQ